MKRIFGSAIFLLLAAGLSSATALLQYTAGRWQYAGSWHEHLQRIQHLYGSARRIQLAPSTDIDTFSRLHAGLVNGSLGTAHGVTITASCTGCDTTTLRLGQQLISGIVNDGDTHQERLIQIETAVRFAKSTNRQGDAEVQWNCPNGW